MVLAVSTFSCLDAISKYLVSHYPAPGIIWARYLVQVALMAAFLAPRMGWALVRTKNLRLQVLRGLVLTGASLLFLTALSYMPLAEAAAIAFMAPIFIALLAGPLLHERVPGRVWVALAIGFLGVLGIVRPGGGLFTWVALLPLACAALMALYQILTRRLVGRDAALTTLLYPAIVGSVAVPVLFPLQLAMPSGALHLALFLAIGVLGGLGHFFLIRAYDHASPALLGPFQYAQLITAVLLGWLFFAQIPDAVAFAGMAAIAASGLLLILGARR